MGKIVLAGGCFWGVQKYFSMAKGVLNTRTGYAQSRLENTTYEQVLQGNTEAVEAVEIEYDEKMISLEKIVELLFRIIDPTSLNKQGNDVGEQYRVGFYFEKPRDAKIAKEYVEKIKDDYAKKIVFEIEKLKSFQPAEEHHQDYLNKNPFGYCHINLNLLKKSESK